MHHNPPSGEDDTPSQLTTRMEWNSMKAMEVGKIIPLDEGDAWWVLLSLEVMYHGY